jgi:hypothetical protein
MQNKINIYDPIKTNLTKNLLNQLKYQLITQKIQIKILSFMLSKIIYIIYPHQTDKETN